MERYDLDPHKAINSLGAIKEIISFVSNHSKKPGTIPSPEPHPLAPIV